MLTQISARLPTKVRPHLIVVSSLGQFCKLQSDGIEALAGFYLPFQTKKRYSQAL
jgi:hypothetical protein